MKSFAFVTILVAMTSSAYAQDKPTCKEQAGVTATRKQPLAGAALTSFMEKCQEDAEKTCDATAAEKKYAGAVKTSFTKKCVSDAVGG